jgi:hypothetical protein
VLELLGPPDQVSGAPFWIRWGRNPTFCQVNTGECIREFTYQRRPGKGDRSLHIGFDVHSNVVSNYRYSDQGGPTVTSP